MRAVNLIRTKRNGGRLSVAEIEWLVGGIASGVVPDYQWAALLMAIVSRGMNPSEIAPADRCAKARCLLSAADECANGEGRAVLRVIVVK